VEPRDIGYAKGTEGLPWPIRQLITEASNSVGKLQNETVRKKSPRIWPTAPIIGFRPIARAMATLPKRRWVHWAVAYLLLGQIQALSAVDRILYGEWLGKPGDKLTQVMNIIQIFVSVALFCRGFAHWPILRKGGTISILMAVFLLCSAAWSVDLGATERAGVNYLFFIIGTIGVAENLEGDDFMHLLAWVCFLSALASLVLLAVSPANAFGGTGDFRGVFSQKNPLGEAMSIGALASLHGLRRGKRGRLFNIINLFLTISLTVKSGSATSLLAIVLFGSFGFAMRLLQKGGTARTLAITGIIVVLPVAFIAAFNPDSLLEMLGKDPTLTGRTDIWGYVIPDIYRRPFLGWGYAAFWSTENPEAWNIADALHWFAPQAHNGILEILLSVGLVGAALFIYLWGRTVWLSLKCLRTPDGTMAITCLSICAGAVLVGVSETVLLYGGPITFMFFITGFYCEKAISTARLPAFRRLGVRAHGRTHPLPRPIIIEPAMRQR
jgi:exopolysaccharide production protein ExoQ